MDLLLTLILSCSVHLDDNLVEALAYKLSVGNQFFVGDLSNLNTYDGAKNAGEARQIAASIQAAGGRPAVGYMAVPVAWAARFGRSSDDLFDGCTNIGVATAMLSEYDRLCANGPSRQRSSRPRNRHGPHARPMPSRRACVLRRLELDMNVEGIVDHVLPVVAKLDGAPADREADAPPARSPVFPGSSTTAQGEPDWSSPNLFLSSTATPPHLPLAAPAAGALPVAGPRPSGARQKPDRPRPR